MSSPQPSFQLPPSTARLVTAARELSLSRDLGQIMETVRLAARELTGADGATFVLRDGDKCFYADENAIEPLWKGRRFPMATCISGWAMQHGQAAVIEDIYSDPRIPHDAYRPTFVKSLAMVPIRPGAPIGAIGNYWADRRLPTDEEVRLLQALADLTSVAMANVELLGQLKGRIEEAQAAIAVRDEFISVAAHELRTPLTALQLQLQMLSGPKAPAAGARALRSTRRLVQLVETLLDVQRLGSGTLRLEPERLDLVEVTATVVDALDEVATNGGSQVTLEAPEPVHVSGDRLRIEQVITHLLSNAFKYGKGGPVTVSTRRQGDTAVLCVRDRGMGIAEDVAQHIFERFVRGVPSRNFGGLGLGLYLCRQIVEAHGGSIAFENEAEGGCTFKVTLPAEPVQGSA